MYICSEHYAVRENSSRYAASAFYPRTVYTSVREHATLYPVTLVRLP